MNKETLNFSIWRQRILKCSEIFILAVVLLEIVCFVGFYYTNKVGNPWLYLIKNIIVPTFLNVSSFFICRKINYSNCLDDTKNKAVIASLMIPSIVITIIHNYFPSVALCMSVTTILCSLFADKKLSNSILLAGFLSIITAFVCCMITEGKNYMDIILNYIITLILFICVHVSCFVVLTYNRDRMNKIYDYQSEQSRFDELLRYDSLTKLLNNNAIMSKIEADINYGICNYNYYVAKLDIKDFRAKNDLHGHAFADGLLVSLSDIIRTEQNGNMISGRYGGAGFILVFSGLEKDTVVNILSRIKRIFKYRNSNEHDILCAVTSYNMEKKPEDILDHIDNLIHLSKEEAVNDVIVG